MKDQNKRKFALWIHPDTQNTVKELYKKDNCSSQSEFIEKAVRFYCGYVSGQSALDYLPVAITSAMSGVVQTSENRIARLLFKNAVELDMVMHVIAETTELSENYLNKLRAQCVKEVKKSTGSVTFEKVINNHDEIGDD